MNRRRNVDRPICRIGKFVNGAMSERRTRSRLTLLEYIFFFDPGEDGKCSAETNQT